MPQPNIILTGFMGTGKTTIGHLLAEQLGYQFIDTDALIEEQAGQTIAEIFSSKGEATFRKLESELVKNLAEKERLVIATGGGLVLNPKNVARLRRTSQIICLTATTEDILARVSAQPTVRPLLQEKDQQKKISQLLQQRESVYRQFPQVSTSDLSPEQSVREIVKLMRAT